MFRCSVFRWAVFGTAPAVPVRSGCPGCVAYGHWAPAPLLCIQTNFAVGMGGCIGPNGCAVLYRTSSNPKRATRNRICITTHRPPFLFERAIAWTSDSKEAFNQAGEKRGADTQPPKAKTGREGGWEQKTPGSPLLAPASPSDYRTNITSAR